MTPNRPGKNLLAGYRALARLLLSPGWQKVDLSWLELPDGHRLLSQDRKSNDLLLRYFHERAEQVDLPVEVTDGAKVLREHPTPSANQDQAFEYPVWLQVSETDNVAGVMVGRYRVGTTELPARAVSDLRVEAMRNIHADGRLILSWGRAQEPHLRCWLPKP